MRQLLLLLYFEALSVALLVPIQLPEVFSTLLSIEVVMVSSSFVAEMSSGVKRLTTSVSDVIIFSSVPSSFVESCASASCCSCSGCHRR